MRVQSPFGLIGRFQGVALDVEELLAIGRVAVYAEVVGTTAVVDWIGAFFGLVVSP